MTLTTTSNLPSEHIVGLVTVSVNCLRKHQFQFDQEIMEELTRKLESEAKKKGGNAVIGISFQLLDPTLHGYVQYQMAAFGTAIKR